MPTPGERASVDGQKGKRPRAYTCYTGEELRLIAGWVEEGRPATEIAGLLGRDVSSVARRMKQLASGGVSAPVGRPRALTPAQMEGLVTVTNEMTEDAKCNNRVNAGMLKAALKFKRSEKTTLEASHE